MATDWHKIRAWNGSREKGFEELCCQLAAGEAYPSGSRFVRKGTPDAGVEAFWTLPGGDEHGWQAKFFTAPPSPGQWTQIDKSVKTVLAKHPRLTRYVICVPIDRPDPRQKGQKSFLDKWNQMVAAWKKAAAKRRMTVEFEFWGDHELTSRLNREENRGRHWFWFSEEQFTLDWFRKKLRVAIENAGERYTPVLHVELPIARHFAALGRTPAFYAKLNTLYQALRKAGGRWEPAQLPPPARDIAADTTAAFRSLCAALDALLEPAVAGTASPHDPIDWAQLNHFGEPLRDQLDRASAALWGQLHPRECEPSGGTPAAPRTDTRVLQEAEYHCREVRRAVSDLVDFCADAEAVLANRPALLLVGEAGQGKTHLLCDVAEKDMGEGRPRIVLHGSHFTDAEPWSQVVQMLGLKRTTDEFLGALEAAGRAYGCRVVILIDALNEGEGRGLWAKHLPGMLATLAGNPWVGLAVSVRSSYEPLVVPDSLVPTRLTRVVHPGFEEHEYEAVGRFFDHYGIQPTTPLLVPEFTNPLFLKLFCQGVRANGWKQVPPGVRGITAVLNMFLDATHERLWRPGRMNYDRANNLVRKAVDTLVGRMTKAGKSWLPREQAVEAVNALHPTAGYDQSLFRNLVAEGVLAENRLVTERGAEELVSFAYERFGDHLLVKHLLDTGFDPRAPKKSFGSKTRLGRLLKSEQDGWRHAGLIEALSVQLPERAGKEVFQVAPHAAAFHPVRDGFVKSLVWRDSTAFSDATFEQIHELIRYKGPMEDFLNAAIALAPVSGHPLNADKLHEILSKPTMPERDSWWSTFLHDEWGRRRAVNRLIDWSWGESDKSVVPDTVLVLTGIALGWFLTTPNRFLRDRATKALVRLFENRLGALRTLLSRFWNVNDPYVLERLIAAGYGSAMRSRDTTGLADLAVDVSRHVFGSPEVLPQVLTRDYARGIVEYARHRGVVAADALSESRPPYRSEWPVTEIPDAETLKKWGEWRAGIPESEWAQRVLYTSVTGDGFADFSQYVIGDLTEWTTVRLGCPPPRTAQHRYDDFVAALRPGQRKKLDTYRVVAENAHFCRRLTPEQRAEHFNHPFTDDELQAVLDSQEGDFLRGLRGDPDQAHIFQTIVKPFIDEPHRYRRDHVFDSSLARRWMVKRVIEYGWTKELFGEFDRNVNRWRYSGRAAHKPERMGKKYQWIAYHELLARLGDNFHMRQDRFSDTVLRTYSGPWDIEYGSARDIDPSVLVRSTSEETALTGRAWWSPVDYTVWDAVVCDIDWLKAADDLPHVESHLAVRNPADGSEWFSLDAFLDWRQPARPGRDTYELPQRTVWYIIRSYLVRKGDAPGFSRWAKRQDFMGRWMPEPGDVYHVYHGEFFWAPAYHAGVDGTSAGDWTRGSSDRLPNDVLVTSLDFVHESSGFDCSVDDSIRIRLPARPLAEGMQLNWTGEEGRYNDLSGRLAAFDPSVKLPGPGALLVRQDALKQYLAANGLELFWTLLGEKQIIGGAAQGNAGWLQFSGSYRLTSHGIQGEITHSYRTHAR